MNLNHILKSIKECHNGELNFNNREDLNCFLYENTWYPLRAVINNASALAQDGVEYTKDKALVKLLEFFPYVKIKQINIQENILPKLSDSEKLEEIAVLSNMINKLTH
ncbi:hypothetical protein [Pedobacter sp. Leaf250]|uniref:hypothetical protein n=1 Tax=Pedobacter sp. Leaf250 TaxID=2876559 RepID=UPI001E39CC90|nr:hypothetical protein [Pedobacter sp. Leaf250]